MLTKIEFRINGKVITGWDMVQVTHAIDSLAGTFVLRTQTSQLEAICNALNTDEPCSIVINNEQVLIGYIDLINPLIQGSESSVTVMGRSHAADLIDSSIDSDKHEFNNIKLDAFIQQLIEPYDFELLISNAPATIGEPFASIVTMPTWSPWDAITHACKRRMILPIAGVHKNIFLTTPGSFGRSADLVYGQNIKKIEEKNRRDSRFSEIIIKGKANSDDFSSSEEISASTKDPDIKRHRPKILQVSGITQDYAQERANWETNIRAAKSREISVSIPGFTQPDGSLWKYNTLARTVIPALGLDTDRLIAKRMFKKFNEGSETQLTLVRPDAFQFKPEVEIKEESW